MYNSNDETENIKLPSSLLARLEHKNVHYEISEMN